MHIITLAAIRAARPCEAGWTTLLRSLGNPPKSAWATTHVTLGDIAASNGAADAWWCVRCLPDEARRDVIRALLPSVKRACAHTTNARVQNCVATIERWINGEASRDDVMAAATAAAWAAAWATAEAEEAERGQQVVDITAVLGRLHEPQMAA